MTGAVIPSTAPPAMRKVSAALPPVKGMAGTADLRLEILPSATTCPWEEMVMVRGVASRT